MLTGLGNQPREAPTGQRQDNLNPNKGNIQDAVWHAHRASTLESLIVLIFRGCQGNLLI